jgi:CubicO group peptidase (beta-lactamase class C family)
MAVSLSVSVLLRAADDLVLSRFGDYLDSLRSQAGIPGLAATLVRPGFANWETAFGRQDLERAIAARPDTPFELDGTSQLLTAGRILRCAEDGRLSLDDAIGQFPPPSPGDAENVDLSATIRQLLSHTSAGPDGLTFSYRPERLKPLAWVIAACTNSTFRAATVDLLQRFAMFDSVPGLDVLTATTPADGFDAATMSNFAALLDRLAKPYAIDLHGGSTPSQYSAVSLTPASGLISTVRDVARFDASLRKGVLLTAQTLADAWTPPLDRNGQRLPHGLGWFVQSYNGERIVWQFGVSDNASSSMIITIPGRGLTLMLLANSQGLARPFPLAAGDILVSPFARLFLSVFVR